ncbi:MAG: ABC transporter substrate-binding protein [Candidatus Acidiferrales bacterium]
MQIHRERYGRKSAAKPGAAIFTLAAVLVGIALFAAGCKGTSQASESGTVNFLIESMPTNLDPRIGTDAQSQHLDGLIFDGLVTLDPQMNIVPDLAERWETPDPRTYVFHLRHGVEFHDGRPFTSADVKYTFDSLMSGEVTSLKRGTFPMLESVDAPDAYTVVFHLSEPYASFVWNLTAMAMGIVPAGSGHTATSDPIGTGPFRFVSMTQDQDIVLERNSDYFGGVPKIPEVRFRVVPDAITRALELRKGTADIGGVTSLTPDMVDALIKEPGIVADDQLGTQIAYVSFNFDDPILAHREVRQALAYATDRATLIRYLLRGQARAASSLLPPNHWAYEPNVRQYPYDPAQAERLLDAAGFPRGRDGARFHVTMKTSTEESTRVLSEALAGQWRRVGVVLDLRPLENATFLADIEHGSFQLYTYRWVGANNDPDIFDYVFNSGRMPPFGANRGHYRNPALDALLEQEKTEMHRDERKAILSQIQKLIAEDEPYIDLWYVDNVCVHRTRVTGIRLAPTGEYDFLDAASIR